jgi:hypothetical protein
LQPHKFNHVFLRQNFMPIPLAFVGVLHQQNTPMPELAGEDTNKGQIG